MLTMNTLPSSLRIYLSSAPGGNQLQYAPRPQHLDSDSISRFHIAEPFPNLFIAVLADLNPNHLQNDISSKKHFARADLRLNPSRLEPQARSRRIFSNLLDKKSHGLGNINGRSKFIGKHDTVKTKPER